MRPLHPWNRSGSQAQDITGDGVRGDRSIAALFILGMYRTRGERKAWLPKLLGSTQRLAVTVAMAFQQPESSLTAAKTQH